MTFRTAEVARILKHIEHLPSRTYVTVVIFSLKGEISSVHIGDCLMPISFNLSFMLIYSIT